MKKPEDRCRLYLISPAAIDVDAFAPVLKETLAAGDVASFQLRLKDAPDDAVLRAAEALIPVCEGFDVAFIMNDRPDLARDAGADGVHLGQSDASVKDARDLLGLDAVIGVTCHNSRHLAFLAGEAGADYVAFGAFFPSHTKDATHHAVPDILAWWSDIAEIPCTAIGGITVKNCAPLIEAGAHFLAVSAGVWDYDKGPAQAVKDFNKLMERHSP